MLAVLIWWAVSARHWFKGPKVNIEHQMLGREGNVVKDEATGVDSEDTSSGSISKDAARRLEDDQAGALA